MRFKEPHLEKQFLESSVVLQCIVKDFALFAKDQFQKEVVITRLWDKVAGESGVHTDKRACDIRDEYSGVYSFTTEQREKLLQFINEKWPRNDGKLTCIHHSFSGAPHHFHLQIPTLTKTYEKGEINNGKSI
jgi:hypothetical protein